MAPQDSETHPPADSSQADPPREAWLGEYHRSNHQLTLTYGIDDKRFSNTYWYRDVDLIQLEEQFGKAVMEKIYLHIAAFEANKIYSLAPETLHLGPFSRYHTEAFDDLWTTFADRIWAQWRFQNDRPKYDGPDLVSSPGTDVVEPAEAEEGTPRVLSFCGGGKDSLVSMRLLERGGIEYSTLTYSNSLYGSQSNQHDIIGGLLGDVEPEAKHRMWIFDDFMESPVLEAHPEYDSEKLLAGETPSSIFAALPLALQHGYRYLSLAHEKSADEGNLRWDLTGEEINHQWGKSLEAERLLDEYIQSELVSNIRVFSILKPIHDVLIFTLLRRERDALEHTHSCNIDKPWCKRCPKCAYVWLNYMAYLPHDEVNPIFEENLLEKEENQEWFDGMIGLGSHKPFECIGEITEARLAFELARRKGLQGEAMRRFEENRERLSFEDELPEYLSVDEESHRIPEFVAEEVLPQFREASTEAEEYLEEVLER